MGSKKNKIRLKRKRSCQGNKYIIASKRNLIESTNSLPDTTGDHSKLNIDWKSLTATKYRCGNRFFNSC